MPLVEWFPNLLWMSLLVLFAIVVGYFSYFIEPKWEVPLKARGIRLPGWMWVLSETTHFNVKYWYVILIGWAAWIGLRRPRSGKPTE
jgi:hypothetical protein